MTALASYATGTISVAANGTVVTGSATIWSGTNVRPGDILQIGNFQTVIADVTDPTHLVIPPWGGGAQAGVAYVVWKVSPQRIAGAQAMADVSALVAALNTTGFFWFVDASLAAPDPSLGSDGQFALQPSTGKMWVHVAGAWSFLGIYRGLGTPAPYDNAKTYSLMDVATSGGSSYVWINPAPGSGQAPPNATYWAVLASKGDQGAQGIQGAGYGGTSTTSLTIGAGAQAFTTQAGLAYQNGARVRATSTANPSNWMEGLATYAGTILTITVDKTNGAGTIASWNFNIVGQPGAGDMSSANYLSELAGNKQLARTNLDILQMVDKSGTGWDFNAIVATGTYQLSNPTNSNAPFPGALWYLEVFAYGIAGYVMQRATPINASAANTYTYVREFVNGTTWYPWRLLLPADDNLAALPNKGAARTNLGAVGRLNLLRFTASGTYNPSANIIGALVEALAGGGAGGGVSPNASYVLAGPGGGAGGRSLRWLTAAQLGAAQTVAIGAGGTGNSAGAGGTGSPTSLGSLVVASGGLGGGAMSTGSVGAPGGGGTITTGDYGFTGNTGDNGHYQQMASTTNIIVGKGKGGDSPYGSGGVGIMGNATAYQSNGNAATGFGAGGGGGLSNQSAASNVAGGAGSSGLISIWEFLAQ
ncbi:pyocin knob domain-containing protein [Bradyrhizobium septentrionale]|uniref:pyocin knob domain-containing protein n=1 Tax=Bradyrhizobium septentrionale TaxID=1404411 RepID=UPI001CD6D5D0|nr:pyocin knob domain-containing protein [Bradyrhizobium septentrionale]UGY23166.1 pyocin knob domain-containing protein [Bradyrhizobium septentrionale]